MNTRERPIHAFPGEAVACRIAFIGVTRRRPTPRSYPAIFAQVLTGSVGHASGFRHRASAASPAFSCHAEQLLPR